MHRSDLWLLAILAVLTWPLIEPSLAEVSRPSLPQSLVPKERAACPSANFAKFFQVFSERPLLQQRFTRLPLTFGKVDLLSPDLPFVKDRVTSFSKIPARNPDNGAIFPTEQQRLQGDYLIAMNNGLSDDFELSARRPDIGIKANTVTVLVYRTVANIRIYYRFIRTGSCWFLVQIDDKST
jgi:hypothetical protein